MYLLDIIPDFPHRPVRPLKTQPDTIINAPDTVTVPEGIPDTVVVDPKQVPDTAKAVMDWVGGSGGDDSSMLFWGALVVVVALALCLWLALNYRRRMTITR